jgi:hypothetical protein
MEDGWVGACVAGTVAVTGAVVAVAGTEVAVGGTGVLVSVGAIVGLGVEVDNSSFWMSWPW